jgi:hypothetical protein
MYPASARFLSAVANPYQVAATAEIRRGGVTVATDLQVVGGEVRVDRGADVRRTCSATVVGLPASLIPSGRVRSPLDVYGNELVLRAGITYPDGVELVPQGVYLITGSDLTDTAGQLELKIEGVDRSAYVSFPLLNPLVTPSGTSLVSAIAGIVDAQLPGTPTVVATASADSTPVHVLEEDADAWADGVLEMARAAGAEAWFHRDGELIIRDVPDPGTEQVAWRFVEGPTCTATALTRSYAAGPGTGNAVVVTGESAENDPVRGEARDLDPESAAFWDGPFGHRPVPISSPLVTTSAQAAAVAKAELRRLAGATETVTITAVPHPALDEGDVVHLVRERSGFDDLLTVESFSLPIGCEGSMVLTCRARRSVP